MYSDWTQMDPYHVHVGELSEGGRDAAGRAGDGGAEPAQPAAAGSIRALQPVERGRRQRTGKVPGGGGPWGGNWAGQWPGRVGVLLPPASAPPPAQRPTECIDAN
ncbi:hypothetical protein EVAR_96004_1 [Eumeta japonica]|uniref:Uncharacterized protein n=1 Tax=Eumeta variegata TaxID=151549 RepID=A0A4C2A9D6_EUMVA|nr:hypothetical protein EVAR_96004_1 [Eumeta japonica]